MMQFQIVQPIIDRSDPETIARVQRLADARGCPLADMFEVYEASLKRDIHYRSEEYQVVVIYHPTMGPAGMTQLSVQRLDGKETPWADKQAIKNHFLGDEAEAVELYPAESRLMDTAPNYHLWAMGAGMQWPFGIFEGRVVVR
jgi:hypothetical protein